MTMEHRGYFRTGEMERDVLSCGHCRQQILLTPPKGCDRKRLGRCGQCFWTLCERCEKEILFAPRCRPFEARLDAYERRESLRRAAGV